MLKRTPLHDEHLKLNGRMVDFGGWELPVQYSGVSQEHAAVRTACGLFDVSHMGELLVEGPGALEFVNRVTTNDASTLAVHQAQYSALCNESGGIIDDLVVYRTGVDRFLLVVNASNTDKDFAHLTRVHGAWVPGSAGQKPVIRNESSQFAQIALQGPKSPHILQTLTEVRLENLKTYWCIEGKVAGVPTLIARTGYTGEDGFELYCASENGPNLWRALLEAGTPVGLLPCGLGARDTLRLEMKYALYGHELTEATHPLETGLGWITKLGKPDDFIGKKALVTHKAEGSKRSLVGVISTGRGIPRQGYPVYNSDQNQIIGSITSGTQSPSLKRPIGIALIEKSYEKPGTRLWVKIRDDFHEIEVCQTPFYRRTP